MSRARLSILSASLLIAACSVGTDQFGTEGSGPATGTFDITSANGLTATKVAWESAVASADLTDLGGDLPITAAPVDVSMAPQTQPTKFLVRVAEAVSFGPIVLPCLESGIVTISGDASDPLAAEDTFRVESTMCDDGAGEVVSGVIDFSVRDVVGDVASGTYMLSMDAVVTNLQIVTGTDTFTSNGDANVTLDTTDSPYVEAGASGTSMTTDSNASSETISNYQSNQTVDGNEENLPYTMTASGTLNTTQLEGIVTYSTPVEFNGDGADYPSVGVFLVQGENSSARLTAIDNVNVMIELDVNGDGEADQTINTTWAELTT